MEFCNWGQLGVFDPRICELISPSQTNIGGDKAYAVLGLDSGVHPNFSSPNATANKSPKHYRKERDRAKTYLRGED